MWRTWDPGTAVSSPIIIVEHITSVPLYYCTAIAIDAVAADDDASDVVAAITVGAVVDSTNAADTVAANADAADDVAAITAEEDWYDPQQCSEDEDETAEPWQNEVISESNFSIDDSTSEGSPRTLRDDAAYAIAESTQDVYHFSEERSDHENWSSISARLRERIQDRKEDINWPYAVWCGKKRDYFRPHITSMTKEHSSELTDEQLTEGMDESIPYEVKWRLLNAFKQKYPEPYHSFYFSSPQTEKKKPVPPHEKNINQDEHDGLCEIDAEVMHDSNHMCRNLSCITCVVRWKLHQIRESAPRDTINTINNIWNTQHHEDFCHVFYNAAELMSSDNEEDLHTQEPIAIAADASILDSAESESNAPVHHNCITIADICCSVALKQSCASVFIQPDIIAAGNTADALSESGPQPTNDHIHADAQMEPCKAADDVAPITAEAAAINTVADNTISWI